MRLGGLDFVPYVLGTQRFAQELHARSPLAETEFVEVLEPDNLTFFRLVNAGNAVAYGEMAMPIWVQLDLATLPSAMFGFALVRSQVPEDLGRRLAAAYLSMFPQDRSLVTYDGLVPVSEFGASFTAEQGAVVGYSMYALLPGLRLGVRSKALALYCMEARRQVGITRRLGPERRAQEVFGNLRILADRPAPHPDAENTIIYELDVPAAPALEAIIRDGR